MRLAYGTGWKLAYGNPNRPAIVLKSDRFYYRSCITLLACVGAEGGCAYGEVVHAT